MTTEQDEQDQFEIPEVLPLLPIRDLVVFPYMIVPLFVSRAVSLAAIDAALARDRLVFLAAQKEVTDDDPAPEGMHTLGTVGMIMRMRKLGDGRVKLLVQGLVKARATAFQKEKPYHEVKVEKVSEVPLPELTLEAEALMRTAKEQLEGLIKAGKTLSPDIMLVIGGIADPGRLADLISSNLGLKVQDAQLVLEALEPLARLRLVSEHLRKESAVQAMQQKIQSQVKEEMSKTQREYYLREQLRLIQQELGDVDGKVEEMAGLREQLLRAKLPPEADEEARKQLRRLDQMHQDTAEAAVLRTYIEWLAELPWARRSEDDLDLVRAAKILDEDHYGLSKVKDRVLEYLGVCKLKKSIRGPILCFAGPPGVGKTSLGRSIARSMGRSFARISLGGVKDEGEIRGHRRTYVGAMPGRILQAMKQAKTMNPVVVLDEIDKLGADVRGDPSAALLEVLDPEQNREFRDHYLSLPFDLSGVLFIATANVIDTIPGPLRDRMEIIFLSGYSEEDKLHIAREHLIPRQIVENGLSGENLDLPDAAVKRLIRDYTREAGLRSLERQVAALCRKIARRVAEGHEKRVKISPRLVETMLGPPPYSHEERHEKSEIGQATGLAWTAAGGEVLHIEASAMKAGRPGLILTGQLGDVMKESAQAALTYTRSRIKELGIPEDFFQVHELHIHVPAGAIPKDGPSAGVTMACALVSLATSVPLRRDVAMTGEVTLRGRVLPVGGLREKILAAMRQGITTVVVPAGNVKDLVELPAAVRRKVQIVPARTVDDALAVALVSGQAVAPKATVGGTLVEGGGA